MIKDISYIIKRIIIGVGIALTLMFLKGNFLLGVNAMTVNGQNVGSQVWSVNPTTNYWYVYKAINGYWNGWGPGYIYFNIGIMKVSTDSVAPLVSPKSIVLSTSTSDFACSFDSSSVNNSTYINQHYSVTCPVDLTNSGLNGMTINLMPNNNTPIDTFEINFDGYMTFVNDSSSFTNDNSGVISSQNNNATANNNNRDANFGNLINDNRANTQAIINNQNTNTQQEIESQNACEFIDKTNIITDNVYLNASGVETSSNAYGVTSYISIDSRSILTNLTDNTNRNAYTCFYDINKTLISCLRESNMTVNEQLIIPSTASFFRLSIHKSSNVPQYKLCRTGNQAIVDSQKEINNTLNNDNVDGANSQASSFFDDFQANSHGLSGVITSPLRLINSLTTASCSPLQFQLPFVHDNVSLPCMRGIYETHFGVFFSLYQLITTGLICYLVMINLYSKIHNLQNPNNDRIEVLNL